MSDSPDPALSKPAPQTPAEALKRLAEALETGYDAPDQARIREILASFKAAGLDKPTQEMVIEARDDAKAGRPPDPLALRMIAKALSSRDAKPAKSKSTPIKAAPGLKDWKPREMIPEAANLPKPTEPFGAAPVEPEPDLQHQAVTAAARRAGTAPGDVETSAAAPTIPEASKQRLEEIYATVDGGVDALRRMADRARANLTDREREILDEHFVDPKEEIEERHYRAATRLAEADDHVGLFPGNGAPPIAQFDVIGGMKRTNYSDEGSVDRAYAALPPGIFAEPEDLVPARTDAEWVALAADVIEHLDMPSHAELCGELYALAQKLEENPIPDPSAAPLLERVEAEIERRIEKAIKSSADLPVWVIEWAREKRRAAPFFGLDLTDIPAARRAIERERDEARDLLVKILDALEDEPSFAEYSMSTRLAVVYQQARSVFGKKD